MHGEFLKIEKSVGASPSVLDLSDFVGGLTPSGFSQEGPINTKMHKLGTISTNFQSVQEKYNFDPLVTVLITI